MTNEIPENSYENDFQNVYDFYFKYVAPIKNMAILFSQSYSLIFVIVIILFGVFLSFLIFLTESKEKQSIIKEIKISDNWRFLNDQLTICQEVALRELHEASDKCYTKQSCNKCIELTTYWPHLINTSLPDYEGITPFHRVCYRGNYSLIEFMISKGANIFQETDSGENALHMLSSYYVRNPAQKNFKSLDLLFKKGYSLKTENFLKQFILDVKELKNIELEEWITSQTISISKNNPDENGKITKTSVMS